MVNRERNGRVAVVELNRPHVRNAIDSAITEELNEVFDELDADDAVWAIVLTGAGDKAFCAGADLKAMASGDRGAPNARPRATGFAGIAQREIRKPIIAAVNGVAMGGGFEIALCCDLVVAEEHATFALPEVQRGIVAAAGGIIRLSQRVPLAQALQIALVGDPLTAEQARALGVVNEVVPTGMARKRAIELAEKICQNAPIAVRLTKQVLRAAVSQGEDALWALQSQGMRDLLSSADAKEGPLAFVEKRAPRWTNS